MRMRPALASSPQLLPAPPRPQIPANEEAARNFTPCPENRAAIPVSGSVSCMSAPAPLHPRFCLVLPFICHSVCLGHCPLLSLSCLSLALVSPVSLTVSDLSGLGVSVSVSLRLSAWHSGFSVPLPSVTRTHTGHKRKPKRWAGPAPGRGPAGSLDALLPARRGLRGSRPLGRGALGGRQPKKGRRGLLPAEFPAPHTRPGLPAPPD